MSKSRPAEVSGILIVNKHAGVTSHHIISICRRLYNTTQVGHTGTLDPMATGVLPVLIGRAVKASEYVMAGEKQYVAEMELGYTTDTEDNTGEVLTRYEGPFPAPEEVISCAAGFVGSIWQMPPMYSAIKIGGRKLVDLARAGQEVEREPRQVEIGRLVCTPMGERTYRLNVTCSKGTYIRTLCADIGKKLGCGAVMSALTRVRSGSYTLEEALPISRLEEMEYAQRLALPRPVETLFTHLPSVSLPDFYTKLIRGGAPVYQKKIHTDFPDGQLVCLWNRQQFFALGRAEVNENESVIRSEKLFIL